MNYLWNYIDKKDFSTKGKIRSFLFLNCSISGVFGCLLWLIVSMFVYVTFENAICFVGYSVYFLGFLGGLIFLCRK